MLRTTSLYLCACLALCFAVTQPAAAQYDRSDSQRMRAVMGDKRTRSEIDAFVGQGAERCIANRPGFELCEWRMGKREAGWKPLAQAIETRARIAVLCELPADWSPRAADSCSAYPMQSNRDRWKVSHSERGRRRPSADISRDKAQNQQRARQMLDSALTMVALSGVVGAIPDECEPAAGGQENCLWRSTAQTWGHGTLATTIKAPYGKKVRMRCTLPGDGSRRAPGSCLVEIGA